MITRINYKIILVGLLFAFHSGFGQISPGELTTVHAHLEGLTNCTKCHVLGEKETTAKCLECHKEIQTLINQKKGYHSSTEVKGKKCAECHGEHFGRDFEIVRFKETDFDHLLAGYKLEGKHAEIKCIDCHKTELIKNKISQKKGETFLGLGTECLSCHEDFHQKTLSSNCLSCHDQNKFRPAPNFEHSKTKFPLNGKHQKVDCLKCHKKERLKEQEFQHFAGIEFNNCTSCHEDVHRNKFGNDCRKCHDENSFTQVKTLGNFNHNQTDFPLLGMHRVVDCKKCHTGSYTKAVKHNRCTDCHKDFHEGQFVKNGVSPGCNECHSVDGFRPSNYGIERHNKTQFKLEGSHLATACFSCHLKEGKWNFANRGIRCIDCHENIHKNIIDEKYMPDSECKTCHSVELWKEISFDHNKTNFQLLGKHTQATCRNCHFREAEGIIKQQFSNLKESCENCHEDVHFKQFEVLGKNDCERCHTFNNWTPDKFNHDKARFKLDGEHVGLKCVQCHQRTNNLIRNYILYKFEDITCASCH